MSDLYPRLGNPNASHPTTQRICRQNRHNEWRPTITSVGLVGSFVMRCARGAVRNARRQKALSLLPQGCGVCRNWGVRKRYIPPPPGVFRKDINPWELLTNFSQGYHSKRLLDAPVVFPAKLIHALFCRPQGDWRPLRRKGPARSGFASFGHTSILQDGASTSSTNTVSAI